MTLGRDASPDTSNELSAEALSALHAGRKIEAIKLVREQHGLGLKEAKQSIDLYLAAHPEIATRPSSRAESGLGRLLLILLLFAIGYGVYRFWFAGA